MKSSPFVSQSLNLLDGAISSESYSREKAVSQLNLSILHAFLHPRCTDLSLSHFDFPQQRAACLTCCDRRDLS